MNRKAIYDAIREGDRKLGDVAKRMDHALAYNLALRGAIVGAPAIEGGY